MRSMLSVGLSVIVICAALATGQAKTGDLVVVAYGSPTSQLLLIDPFNPSSVTVLPASTSPGGSFHWVRMDTNNRDLVVAEASSNLASSDLLRVRIGGNVATLATSIPRLLYGFELDGDNTWIAVSAKAWRSSEALLLSIDPTSGVVKTLVSTAPFRNFTDLAIVREGIYHYAIANAPQTALTAPKLYGANRGGITTTLVTGSFPGPIPVPTSVELRPKTGDLVVTQWIINQGLHLVDRSGGVTSLPHPGWTMGFVGTKVNQDDTLWAVGFPGGQTVANGILKYDLANQTVIMMRTYPAYSTPWGFMSVEVYGSRPLTVNGQGGPNSTIAIELASQLPRAAGAFYQIAASGGRRPGLQTGPNGNFLHLNVLDPIFLTTAQNRLPIARRFSGSLNASGKTIVPATLTLPSGFPSNLGLTIFVAAVIFDRGGIIEVTNTHWFEL